MEGERGVLGGDRQCHSTGAAAGDKGIDDDRGRRDGSHRACPNCGTYGSRGEVEAARLRSQDDQGDGGEGRTPRELFSSWATRYRWKHSGKQTGGGA